MMKKMKNEETIEGRVYQFNLEVKQVKNQDSANFGKDFISGTLDVAVDEEGMNVIPVHYTYVAPVTNKGSTNATYTALKKIIDTNKTWMSVGKDQAMMVRCTPSLDVNDFYNKSDELVSAKVNEGGFCNIISKLNEDLSQRSRFETDILINNVKEVEANEEKGTPAKVIVHGVVFNFRNEILPVDLEVCPAGQSYFLGLDASPKEPVFTKVTGKITCQSETVTKREESAFGDAVVTTYEKNTKTWTIIAAKAEPYEFGGDETLNAEDIKKAMQDREVKLAEIKRKSDEYKATKASTGAVTAATPQAVAMNIANSDFKF